MRFGGVGTQGINSGKQRLQSGGFANAEDVMLQALRAFEFEHPTGADLVAAMQSSPFKEIEPARGAGF